LRFTALLHHIYNLETLRMAYFRLKKEAAPGVDGETWRHYGETLEGNLQDLAERLKRGAYRAKPVRRVFIPRPTGGKDRSESRRWKTSSSSVRRFEVLNAIYETDFLDFVRVPTRAQPASSAGCSVHGTADEKSELGVDLDIKGFFDGLSHEWLVKFVEHRIADRRVVRLIRNG